MRALAVLGGLLLAAALGASVPAVAQTVATQHIRGQITAADDSSITVKTRAGATVRLALASDVSVSSLTKAGFSDLKAGAYIGSAAVPIRPAPRTFDMKTPTLTALEVQIFPESMRGVGEGQRKWDLTPDSTMTSGTVLDVEGRVLSIRFRGNDRDVHVPPQAPIVKVGPGDRGLLKPGAHVFAVAQPGANGSLTALRVSVGMGGLVPPM